MHYLIYLKPPEEILELLQKETSEYVYPPPSGYHITIWRFTPHDKYMGRVRKVLRSIARTHKKFDLRIEGLVSLGRDRKKIWAMKTTRPPALFQLQAALLSGLRDLDRNPHLFDVMSREIGGIWYIPHISLNRGEREPKLSHVYDEMGMGFHSFHLKTKERRGESVEIRLRISSPLNPAQRGVFMCRIFLL
jgi:2'-5' RNA ligase